VPKLTLRLRLPGQQILADRNAHRMEDLFDLQNRIPAVPRGVE
jgi:hypothetical protein